MNTSYPITKVDYSSVERVMNRAATGAYVKYRGVGGKVEEIWIEPTCTFTSVPTGIVIEKQFSGDHAPVGGFKICVTPSNTGTVELSDCRVVA